uniref:DNA repair metallo-beta-lactamase domain-containing protein n=1 Tax=Tetranychus urticae TaxID=32264 RepID=T1L155_TETUR
MLGDLMYYSDEHIVTVSGRTWNFFALNSPKPCQSSDDCRRGECCAIGFARFSVPMCKPMGRINDWCYPDNEPENMTLHYPYGSEAYTNVHRNFCPYSEPLRLNFIKINIQRKLLHGLVRTNSYRNQRNDDAQIHVLPMTDINHEFLRGYLRGCRDRFTSILAFKPSGWQNNEDSSSAIVPAIQDNVYIYGIPYSEHSSYSELERFIKFFKPRMITPTVFHSDSKFRVMMLRSIAQWKSTYLQNGDQQSSA